MCHGIDFWNNLIHRIISYNWKDRAKDLLLHHRILEGHRVEDSRFNAQGIRIGFPAISDFAGRDQVAEPVKMFLIDDFAVIRILKWCFRILPPDLFDQMLHETVLDLAVAVDIIRGDAGLPAV